MNGSMVNEFLAPASSLVFILKDRCTNLSAFFFFFFLLLSAAGNDETSE